MESLQIHDWIRSGLQPRTVSAGTRWSWNRANNLGLAYARGNYRNAELEIPAVAFEIVRHLSMEILETRDCDIALARHSLAQTSPNDFGDMLEKLICGAVVPPGF